MTLLYVLLILIVGYALVMFARIHHYSTVSDELVAAAEAREHLEPGAERSILIIGDSLWAGVGAEPASTSMAARLVNDLPDAHVVNQAESGARLADGRPQLQQAIAEHGHFDQIIIQLGANDIVALASLSVATGELRALLKAADEAASDVAYMVSGSVGFAPLFWQPLDWFYTAVSRHYLKKLSRVSESLEINYIDLYRTRSRDPFYQDPDRYYARDKFHPSGAGYGLWYEICRNNLQCFAWDEIEPAQGS